MLVACRFNWVGFYESLNTWTFIFCQVLNVWRDIIIIVKAEVGYIDEVIFSMLSHRLLITFKCWKYMMLYGQW